MIDIERRALFNSLRQHWLIDRTLPVKEWQVLDYRKLRNEELFSLLAQEGYPLERDSFIAYAEASETPEEMTMQFIGDEERESDRLYLILFELWRRFLPERRVLSIFCDELDRCIYAYDQEEPHALEPLETILADLLQLIAENKDAGEEGSEILALISKGCANDIELFLFDFISERLDAEDYAYAKEYIEGLQATFQEAKWLRLLETRLLVVEDPHAMRDRFEELLEEEEDVEFHLELARCLAQVGDRLLFRRAVEQTMGLLEVKEDYLELVSIVKNYLHAMGHEQKEAEIGALLKEGIRKSDFNMSDLSYFLALI